MGHGRALRWAVGSREALEGVVHHVVREGDLVGRKVALEHAAVRPELLDGVVHPRRHSLGQLLRPYGYGPVRPVESPAGHAHAAQLAGDVGALGDGRDALPPRRYDFVVLAGVDARAADAPEVVEYDGYLGHGTGELGDLIELREGRHDVQRQPSAGQHTGAGTEGLVGQDAGRLAVVDPWVGTPGDVVADAFETVGAGGLKGIEDAGNVVAELEVGGPDDGGSGPGLAVNAAGAGRRQALHELHLADGSQLLGAAGTVHGPRLQEYRGAHVVA